MSSNNDKEVMRRCQEHFDNLLPRDPSPEFWRCVQCGHHFDISEAEEADDCLICPACGDNDITAITPEDDHEPPDADGSIDEAAAFGGREYP